MLDVLVLKHEMPMRTFIYQFPAVALLWTPACSSLLIHCQWSGAHSTSLQSVIWKKGKCSYSWPRNASVYPTLLLAASSGSVFHTLLGCALWDCCLFAECWGSAAVNFASCKSKCPPCSSALKTPVSALVEGGVDRGVMSGPELIHGLAFKSGSFCIKVATETGLTNENL